MSTRIASLYAEISADPTKFNQGLAQAKSGLTGFSGMMQSTWATIATGVGIAAAAMVAGNKVINATVGEYVRLAEEVERFHFLTGMTAEDSSRVVEVMKDLGISADAAGVAFKFAIKNGFEPTIENLAAMQAQYDALGTGMERTQFLLDNFGKSGTSLQKFFETGDIAERLGSVGEALIISEEQIASVQEYNDAVDDVSDAWMGLKVVIGKEALPALADVIGDATSGNTAIGKVGVLSGAAKKANMSFVEFTGAVVANRKAFADLSTPVDSATQSYIGMAKAAEEAARANNELAGSNTFLYSETALTAGIAGDLGRIWVDYENDMTPLIEEHAALAAELANVQANYPGWTSKINELTGALDANEASQRAVEEATMKAANAFIFEQGSVGLTGKALYDFANAMGMIDDDTYAAALAIQGLRAEFDAGRLSATDFANKSEDVIDAIKWLHANGSGKITLQMILDVIANWTNSSAPPPGTTPGTGGAAWQQGGGDQPAGTAAAGGNFGPGWVITGDAPGGGWTPYTEAVYAPGGAVVMNASQTRARFGGGGARGYAGGGVVPPAVVGASQSGMDESAMRDFARLIVDEIRKTAG